MKTKEVIEFFGSIVETGRAIGVSGQAVSQWGEDVPRSRLKSIQMAMHLEMMRRAFDETDPKKKA